ncbi:DNA internalization-related competence protein ComEC/Rec2 [Pseudoalteromonas sp. SMS1]|nr:DNA internalization-related competence protein ComEC/Rec2 [Pseudoalteromonas sp. SMS1]
MLVFVSSYFKLFSNVLAGFILGIFVTVFHYFTFYHISWASEVVDKPVKIRGYVSKVINRSRYSYIKLDVVQLDKFHTSPIKTVYANLSVTKSAHALQEGDEIIGRGRVRLFRSRKNFDVFDSELYAFRNHLYFKGRIEVDEVVAGKSTWRASYQDYLATIFEGYQLGWLYYVLLSGDRTNVTIAQKRDFRQIGLGHLLAISGLHIGIIFSLSFIVFKCLTFAMYQRLKQGIHVNFICLFGALSAAGLYVVLSGMQVSAQRAWLMACLGVVGYALGLQLGFVRVVLYTLTVIVLFSPFSLLNMGLYFSFSAVLGILWCLSRRRHVISVHRGSMSKIKTLMKIQVVVFVFLLPWSVYVFQGVSASGVLINLIVIPLLGLIVFPAIAVQAFIGTFMHIKLIGTLDWLLFEAYRHAIQFEFNWITLGKLTFSDLGLILLSMVLLLIVPTARYASVPALILSVRWLLWQPPNWQIDIFDVGHGSAVLVSKHGKGFLYDLGANYFGSYSIFENVVLPYMTANNIVLAHTVISHDDGDHAGGLNHLIEHGFERTLDAFHGAPYQQPCLARALNFEGLFIKVLWPNEMQNNDNNNSCVITINDGNIQLLLPGDIELRSERTLVQSNDNALRSTILLAPHHGSNTSSSMGFIQAVNAEVVVFSRGYHSPWRLPHQDVVSRYHQAGYKMFDTALHGHIQIRIFSNRYQVFLAREAKNLWFLR